MDGSVRRGTTAERLILLNRRELETPMKRANLGTKPYFLTCFPLVCLRSAGVMVGVGFFALGTRGVAGAAFFLGGADQGGRENFAMKHIVSFPLPQSLFLKIFEIHPSTESDRMMIVGDIRRVSTN